MANCIINLRLLMNSEKNEIYDFFSGLATPSIALLLLVNNNDRDIIRQTQFDLLSAVQLSNKIFKEIKTQNKMVSKLEGLQKLSSFDAKEVGINENLTDIDIGVVSFIGRLSGNDGVDEMKSRMVTLVNLLNSNVSIVAVIMDRRSAKEFRQFRSEVLDKYTERDVIRLSIDNSYIRYSHYFMMKKRI